MRLPEISRKKLLALSSATMALLCLLWSATVHAQPLHSPALQARITRILDSSRATVGMAVMNIETGDSLIINGNGRYPMQSTYKFPLAIAILHMADQGKLSLTQKIHITKESLDTNTWSPMVKDYPHRDIDMTIADLLRYSISKSDNNACDILFKQAGGTAAVNKYIHSLGITGIAIAATERQMKQSWQVQYTNWCQPAAMLQLLRLFYNGKVLSPGSNSLLMRLMTDSENSPNRIKGLLPTATVVAHKTGTSNTNKLGLTAAVNDIGIITLPTGTHIAIVIFVSDSKAGGDANEHTIAALARAVWDNYSK